MASKWWGRSLMRCAWVVSLVCISGARPAFPQSPSLAPISDAGTFVTAATTSGAIRGKVSDDGTVEVFQGIPYAAPPVGALRWAPPQPPAKWSGLRDALGPGSPCPQTGGIYASVTEDCLYLSVWKPHGVTKLHRGGQNRLPVMVFIHGGGQTASASNDYKPDWLVTRGTPVIYVAMNYRLNIFAFYAHKVLSAENPAIGSGNYATLDQQQALRWVRDNIANFGGDPHNVTVFGESGGAQAVCILLASPPAGGLFHKAISESGPCQWQHYQSLTSSEKVGVDIATQLGCTAPDPLPCLRALPVATLLTKQGTLQPVWGGGAFPLPIRDSIASGRFNQVPMIQGSNRLEGLWTITPRYDGGGAPLTAAQYPQVLTDTFGASRVSAILEQYPLSDYPTPLYALAAALSDASMSTNGRVGLCVTHLANQIMSPHIPLYSYVFSDATAPYPAPIFTTAFLLGGAAHTKELSYLFHQNELTPAQRTISDLMIGYWTNFAKTGNPNGSGLPRWPQYAPELPNVMNFESSGASADTSLYSRHKCKFWNEQGFGLLHGPYPTPTSQGPVYQ